MNTKNFKKEMYKHYAPHIDFARTMEKLRTADPSDKDLVFKDLQNDFDRVLETIFTVNGGIDPEFIINFIEFTDKEVKKAINGSSRELAHE